LSKDSNILLPNCGDYRDSGSRQFGGLPGKRGASVPDYGPDQLGLATIRRRQRDEAQKQNCALIRGRLWSYRMIEIGSDRFLLRRLLFPAAIVQALCQPAMSQTAMPTCYDSRAEICTARIRPCWQDYYIVTEACSAHHRSEPVPGMPGRPSGIFEKHICSQALIERVTADWLAASATCTHTGRIDNK
jgi:hypothetical protein